MKTDHIVFDPEACTLGLLDQRLLPGTQAWLICRTAAEVADALKKMAVRGAPAIGVAAAWGCVLAAARHKDDARELLLADLQALRGARPTAVNLAWAIDRMESLLPRASTGAELLALWLEEARVIQGEDVAICQALGCAGASLVPDGATVLTHCNAGALATAGHGTALGVIRSAIAQGKRVRVIADETRPLLQGSRLTAFELHEDGIDVRLICDNAAPHLMARGEVDLVIVGADRIAANGDTANKIGTLGVAIAAQYFAIPFYVAAPISTMDPGAPTGAAIPIEERMPEEVLTFAGAAIAPPGVGACNFAFDITPGRLISAIITEKGVLRPPYGPAIAAACARGRP